MGVLSRQFTATLQKSPTKGGWTYVVMPGLGRVLRHPRPGEGHRHRRRPPVPQLVHGPRRRHATSCPIKADVRKAIAKEAGDTVTVSLEERLS